MSKMYYVYMYKNPETGIPMYVGKGHGNRDISHLKKSHNRRLSKEISKMLEAGMQPDVERIITSDDHTEVLAEEIRQIKLYGRKGFDPGGVLMNFTLGGEGALGRVRTRESIERGAAKQRGIARPESCAAVSEGTRRAMENPEVRNRIRLAKSGVPCPPETRAKLSAFFSTAHKGAGNPAAKSWIVTDPSGIEYEVADLKAFCALYSISYVGLKSSFRSQRPVQRGGTTGWSLKINPSAFVALTLGHA